MKHHNPNLEARLAKAFVAAKETEEASMTPADLLATLEQRVAAVRLSVERGQTEIAAFQLCLVRVDADLLESALTKGLIEEAPDDGAYKQ